MNNPLENTAFRVADAALKNKMTIALIGPTWRFSTEYMGVTLKNTLKEEVTHYDFMRGYMKLKNGTEIIFLSSFSKDLRKVYGKDIDLVWVHGDLPREIRTFLITRRVGHIIYSN